MVEDAVLVGCYRGRQVVGGRYKCQTVMTHDITASRSACLELRLDFSYRSPPSGPLRFDGKAGHEAGWNYMRGVFETVPRSSVPHEV